MTSLRLGKFAWEANAVEKAVSTASSSVSLPSASDHELISKHNAIFNDLALKRKYHTENGTLCLSYREPHLGPSTSVYAAPAPPTGRNWVWLDAEIVQNFDPSKPEFLHAFKQVMKSKSSTT